MTEENKAGERSLTRSKGEIMEQEIFVFGIEEEYEGIGTLWFDLNKPEILANYLKDNIKLEENRVFKIARMTKKEFEDLE